MARPKEQGKEIGPNAVKSDGPVFPVKSDADKTALKNRGHVVKVNGGYQVRKGPAKSN